MRYQRTRFLILIAAVALPTSTALGQSISSRQALPPALKWETTLSISATQEGADEMAVDSQGNVIVLGYLPVERDFYVLKFSPAGSLTWSTTLGGSAQDYATGLALDPVGNIYVTGSTTSDDFPTQFAYQSVKNGPSDAFLVKLSGASGGVLFSTLFGGTRHEWAHDVAIGPDGSIYIAGQTDSADLEVVDPIQAGLTLNQCFCDDAFVTRFTPRANAVIFSTYFGGTFDDAAREIEVDADANVLIAGITRSGDFPTRNAVQSSFGGGEYDAFVAKISATNALAFSTFLGGEDWEITQGMDVDGQGAVYVAGSTRSVAYPTTPGAFQAHFVGGILACDVPFGQDRNCFDMFVTKLDLDGSLSYSTFIGGHQEDEPRSLVVDGAGRAHVIGYTYSSDFPMKAPFGSVVVMRLAANGRRLHYVFTHDTPGANGGSAVALDGEDLFIAGSVGLPYDTYVAKFQIPWAIFPR